MVLVDNFHLYEFVKIDFGARLDRREVLLSADQVQTPLVDALGSFERSQLHIALDAVNLLQKGEVFLDDNQVFGDVQVALEMRTNRVADAHEIEKIGLRCQVVD